MEKGSVIVDVAIDQGGCIATIDRVTTHDNPSYEKYGAIHYSVANIPGCVPRTSTLALAGLNTFQGAVTCKGVAESLGLKYVDPAGLWAGIR